MGYHAILFMLWTAVMSLINGLEMSEDEMKTISAKFCGNHLAETLSALCESIYNTERKRSGYSSNAITSHGDYEDESSEYLDDRFLPFPFKSKQRAQALVPLDFRKRSKGIVSECCHKACSMWELYGYCGNR